VERECLLTVLVAMLGGSAIAACAGWPAALPADPGARSLERALWRRIWGPLVPAGFIAAALCGWALAEPDPVPERVPPAVLIAAVPFFFVAARAAVRAGWSLVRDDGDPDTVTVGLLRPWVVFSPYLARALDDSALEAALEHERAHARNRDPLRIWLAQIAIDLQWPWPQAQSRLGQWIVALELARDEEARAAGVDGADLARAILAAARMRRSHSLTPVAALIGEKSVLEHRIARLTSPMPAAAKRIESGRRYILMLASGLLAAVGLGTIFGEAAVAALLRIAA